ncbi:hypothetical protein K7X08_020482 [Anisodus acutangulus]|uniref:Uncharacterized protein n=1 Tax=Anisodus acutangulus TaxID=402998 RepID=A0A9Q1RF15_9SOLA|nr:hypothetical protein K7X08_020482 [Anisodus acutangulus]
MECYGGTKKRSFSYDIGDQKLKLIDISSEEDCLIDSPLFDSLEDLRLSVTLNSINDNGEGSNLPRTSFQRDKTTQVNQQKELKHLSSAPIQPGRPSFLRKSSAWDNAFFTSAGLLDPHELSLMNKDFDTSEGHLLPVILEDVRARRPVLPSISDFGTGSRNTRLTLPFLIYRIDRGPVSKRKNINNVRAERSKTEEPCKRRECNSLDLKLPKVPRASKSASTWQSEISSPHMYPVDIRGNKRTGPGRDLVVSNSTTHSSTTSCPSYETSAYARKRRETGKSKHSASVSSTKTPIRSSTKTKKFENLSSSMESNLSPLSTTSGWSLKSSSSTSSTNRAHRDSNHRLYMTFRQTRNLWSPGQCTGRVASVPRENSQPSSLCMPSPKFGFFDEDISVVRTFDGNSNQSHKKGMSASVDKGKSAEASTKVKRARSPLCTDNVNRGLMRTRLLPSPKVEPSYMRKGGLDKSMEIDRKASSKLRKVGAGEHDRKKVGQVNGILKTKLERGKIMVTKYDKGINTTTTTNTPQSQSNRDQLYESSLTTSLHLTPSHDKGITSTSRSRKQENEVNDLSKYLELIDLNDGTETQLKQKRSLAHMRAPLVEKKSVCNRSVALMRSDMIKDKESSNLLSSKGTDKENN